MTQSGLFTGALLFLVAPAAQAQQLAWAEVPDTDTSVSAPASGQGVGQSAEQPGGIISDTDPNAPDTGKPEPEADAQDATSLDAAKPKPAPAETVEEQPAGQPLTPVGAPAPATSYDSYQNQLGVSGRSNVYSGLFEERGLRRESSLDRYRSLAQASNRYSGATVAGRRRPEYDATGLNAGGFTLYPAGGIEADYISNVFRQRGDTSSDVFAVGNAELLARSNWSRHQLVLGAAVEQRVFAKFSSEDTTAYGVNAGGRVDVSPGVAVFLNGAHEYDYTNRRSVVELLPTRSPIKFVEDSAEAKAVIKAGRFTLSPGVAYEQRRYSDAESPAGQFLDMGYRDYDSWKFGGEVAYEFMRGKNVFLSLTDEQRRFPVRSTPSRDVDIVEVLGGLSSDITPLISGRFGVGYLWGNFKEAGAGTRKGFTFDIALTYLASELTTFTLTARRNLNNVALPNTPAAFMTVAGLQVDHELLRNLIIGADVSYRRGDFVDNGVKSDAYRGGLNVQWLLSRHLRTYGQIGYGTSHSNSPTFPGGTQTFEARVGLGVQM